MQSPWPIIPKEFQLKVANQLIIDAVLSPPGNLKFSLNLATRLVMSSQLSTRVKYNLQMLELVRG